MRLPIQSALTYPRRVPHAVARLDLRSLGSLNFEAPDDRRFPCLGLARDALRRGGTAPAALNAANEAAVRLFLDRRLPFTAIAPAVRRALDADGARPVTSIDDIFEADRAARAAVEAARRAESSARGAR
jgi:1-deoxy-D-xylulose-5-phosphate reductoisomerase